METDEDCESMFERLFPMRYIAFADGHVRHEVHSFLQDLVE